MDRTAMRLIVLMSVFNEERGIAKAIESVHDVADEIWVFDGAFKEYPHEKPYSTDRTLNIARLYDKVRIFECKEAWENQIQKRSAMFKEGREGDVFFILDGDEYVANPEMIRKYSNFDVGWGWTISNLYDQPTATVRLLKYQEGLHYAGRHYWIYNGKKTFVVSHQNMNPRFKNVDTLIRVFNFRDSSCPERREAKKQFLQNRLPYEGSYKSEDEVYPERGCRLIPHQHRASKPREHTTVIRDCTNPDYTMSLMFSRSWAVRKYFRNLRNMWIPENTEVVCVIDTQDNYTRERVIDELAKSTKFVGVKVIITGREKIAEFKNVSIRRQRIVDNWNFILAEARGKIMLGSEDDSLPQPDAYKKLLDTMEREKVDFVQANIVGRWHVKMCPAWKVMEVDNQPIAVYNEKEKSEGVDSIQGVGWYCFVTPVDVMRKYPMQLDNLLPVGPDLRFGYELHRHGYKLLHDWSVKVHHFGETFDLYPGEQETEQRIWVKGKDDEWEMHSFEPRELQRIKFKMENK